MGSAFETMFQNPHWPIWQAWKDIKDCFPPHTILITEEEPALRRFRFKIACPDGVSGRLSPWWDEKDVWAGDMNAPRDWLYSHLKPRPFADEGAGI